MKTDKLWRVVTLMVPVVKDALGTVTPPPPQTGKVAPTYPKIHLRDICPEKQILYIETAMILHKTITLLDFC